MPPNPPATAIGTAPSSSNNTSNSYNDKKMNQKTDIKNPKLLLPPPKKPASSKPPAPVRKLSAVDKLPFGFSSIQNFSNIIRARSTTPTRTLRSRSTTPASIYDDSRSIDGDSMVQNRIPEILENTDDELQDFDEDFESGKKQLSSKKNIESNNNDKIIKTNGIAKKSQQLSAIESSTTNKKQHISLADTSNNSSGAVKKSQRLVDPKIITNGKDKILQNSSNESPTLATTKIDPVILTNGKDKKLKSSSIESSNLASKTKVDPVIITNGKDKKLQNSTVESPNLATNKVEPVIIINGKDKKLQKSSVESSSLTSKTKVDPVVITNGKDKKLQNSSVESLNLATSTKKPPNTLKLKTTKPFTIEEILTSPSEYDITSPIISPPETPQPPSSTALSTLKKPPVPPNQTHVRVQKKSKLTATIEVADSPGFKLSKLPSTSDMLAAVTSKLNRSSINNSITNDCEQKSFVDQTNFEIPSSNHLPKSSNVLSVVDSKMEYTSENNETVTTPSSIDERLRSSKVLITEGFQLYKLPTSSDILTAVDSKIESSCVDNKFMLNSSDSNTPNTPKLLKSGYKLSKKSSSSNIHALLQMNSDDDDDDDPPTDKDKNVKNSNKDGLASVPEDSGDQALPSKGLKLKKLLTSSSKQSDSISKNESGKTKKKNITRNWAAEFENADDSPTDSPTESLPPISGFKLTKLNSSSNIYKEINTTSPEPNKIKESKNDIPKKLIKSKKISSVAKTSKTNQENDLNLELTSSDLTSSSDLSKKLSSKSTSSSTKNFDNSSISVASDELSNIGFIKSRGSVPPSVGSTLLKLPSSSDILAAVEEKFEANYLNNRNSRASSVVGMPSMRRASQSPGPSIDSLNLRLTRTPSASDIVARVRAQSVAANYGTTTTGLSSLPNSPAILSNCTGLPFNSNPTTPILSNTGEIQFNPLKKLPSSSDILAAVESKFETSYVNNRPTNVLIPSPTPSKKTKSKHKKVKNILDTSNTIEIPKVPNLKLNTELLAKAQAINKMSQISNQRHSIHGSLINPDTSLLPPRSPSPSLSTHSNLSTISNFTNPSINRNTMKSRATNSRSMSIATDNPTERSMTPRRIFPQTYSRNNSLDVNEMNQMEQSPVVFDANLSFVLGCNKQPLHQAFRASASHTDSQTASNYLSDRISSFLKRTDHVMEEWKQVGKRKSIGPEDTISLIERQRERNAERDECRLGRSRSAQNILLKSFQLTKGMPSMSRASSISRSISFMEDDETDDRTICEDDEVNKFQMLSDLTVDLAEERSTSNMASERLEAETGERLKLEKELQESQSKVKKLQESSEKLEMELICAKSDLNGVSEDEDNDNEDTAGGVYKLKYERVARELEFTKRRLQTQHEHDLEQLVALKKQLEKKLADAYEEVEEQRQVVGQWKRKAQKMTNEMNDLRMLLEEQNGRNNLLEKKQRKFDSECQALQDAARQERQAKDRLAREKDVLIAEKFTLEQNLADTRLELDLKEEKLAALQRELEEMTFSGGTEEEVAQLRRSKMDQERRLKEQEEELDEMAGQVQLLEQAKLRLEMTMETMRKEARREAQQRDDELEEARGSAYKKIKALECQLETEHEERTLLLREKHELERRLQFAEDQDRHDRQAEEAINQKLKRELKKYKALLKDAYAQLERLKADSPGKAIIRQLRNQLEDAEAARTLAVKSRHTAESELQDVQTLLDEAQRTKHDAEEKATIANRDRAELQAQIEENEEEMSELMKKYSASVKQLNNEQTAMSEYEIRISELETERNALKEQVAELTTRLENVENMSDSSATVQSKRLELRTKELESRLELEQATKARLEIQANRHKDALEKIQNELAQSKMREMTAQDNIKKSQKSLRELREEFHTISNRDQDSVSKRKDLEKKLETVEAECASLRNDLRLALQRIDDLQQAMEEGDDDVTESESDSSDASLSDLEERLKPIQHKKASIANGDTKVVLREKNDSNSPKITVTSPSTGSISTKNTNGDTSFA